jgi:hypothetical protein
MPPPARGGNPNNAPVGNMVGVKNPKRFKGRNTRNVAAAAANKNNNSKRPSNSNNNTRNAHSPMKVRRSRR